ncbi:MAG: DUF488 domain-containing protein, partial [Deltaproteobacteria bacterium]|nr:DUF488 domain-containing protein [Candidatus Tharpellaceae bacterium]
ELFTIGYAAHTKESFLDALKILRITALADVRARPYSSFKPEFSQEPLKYFLLKNDIVYVSMGDQLGVSISNLKECSPTRTAFQVIAESENFKKGLERIENGLQKHRIALMCAEKDPLCCHRFLLICHHLLPGSDRTYSGSWQNRKAERNNRKTAENVRAGPAGFISQPGRTIGCGIHYPGRKN